MARRLTQAERDFVVKHYPRWQAKETARRFNRRFGANRTANSMRKLAYRLGVSSEVAAGYYSVSEVAMFCGLHRDAVVNQIQRGTINAKQFGKRYLIEESEADRVIRKYTDIPKWKAVTSIEAAERLGYALGPTSGNQLTGLAIKREIPSYNLKGVRYVPLAYIEAAEQQMRETGRSWVSWREIQERFNYAI